MWVQRLRSKRFGLPTAEPRMPDWTFASPWQQRLKDADAFPVSLCEGRMKVICRLLFPVVSLASPRLSCPVLPILLIAAARLAERRDRRPALHQLVTRSTRAWTGAENVPRRTDTFQLAARGAPGPLTRTAFSRWDGVATSRRSAHVTPFIVFTLHSLKLSAR